MSLTIELNKKQSPFRQLVESCSPAPAIAGGRSPENKRIAEQLGFYELTNARLLAPGADGDWFIDDTLFDFKVVDKIRVPWVRKVLMQLLGYLILDLDNDYQAECIGIWLPRQAMVRTWETEAILGGDAGEALAKARRDVLDLPMKRMRMIA
jgi:hypothetical protein avisC_04876